MFKKLRDAVSSANTALSGTNDGDGATKPPYIQAEEDNITNTYGEEISTLVFSDQLTGIRWLEVNRSLPDDVEKQWVLFDVEACPVAGSEPSWIERYHISASDGQEYQRNLLAISDNEEILYTNLVPGTTLSSVTLQNDALPIVFNQLILGPLSNHEIEIKEHPVFTQKGIPNIWPEGMPAMLVETHVLTPPENNAPSWSERWAFLIEGTPPAYVFIDFEAANDGGTIIKARLTE